MEDALSLDVKVLEALLRRNRCSHGRTQYFKRISMAMRALQRRFYPLFQQALLLLDLKHHNARRNEEWTWQGTKSLHARVLVVQRLFDTVIPEIIGRIQYAASALLSEMKRGFFLPFCTVALGALARIRIIVTRVGRDQLSEFQLVVSECNLVLEPVLWFENTMKLLEEDPTIPTNDDGRGVSFQLQSLGLVPKKSQRTKSKEVQNDKTKKIDAFAHGETNFLPDKQAAIDDIGTSVVVRTTGTTSTDMLTPSNLSHQDESDRNLKLLPSIKISKTDRKRTTNESEMKKKKKRRKKEKKKDILDQIFGDM